MRPAAVLMSLLLLPACAAQSPGEAEDTPPVSGERDLAAREQAVRRLPEQVERLPPPAVVGEVPGELLQRIRADAAARLGIGADDLVVVRAESVTWNDGSLGCAQPDAVYTQALEPGYRVVMQAGDRQLDYRARARGDFFVCDAARARGPRR